MPGQACASAPGKLFLFGEYAVLEGASAIVTAVDRRALAHCQPSPSGWSISAADLALEHVPLWPQQPAPDTRLIFVQSLLDVMAERGVLPARPQHLIVSTQAFHDDAGKLGLGSSAALTGALLTALLAAADIDMTPGARFDCALAAHRRAQSGRGSGGDVAAALWGGTLDFGQDRQPEPLAPLDALTVLCVRAGAPASTGDLLASLNDRRADTPAVAHRLAELVKFAEQAVAAWRAADAVALIGLADAYGEGMTRLGRDADLPIAGPRDAALRQLARAHGGAYKPSGAGGGDVGLIFMLRRNMNRRIMASLRAEGVAPLALSLHARGAAPD
jgi:phosphomevalonate kinase